jgi:hypothetical protein
LGDLQQRCIILPIQDQVARLIRSEGRLQSKRCEDALAFRMPQVRIKSGEFDLDLGRMSSAAANHPPANYPQKKSR